MATSLALAASAASAIIWPTRWRERRPPWMFCTRWSVGSVRWPARRSRSMCSITTSTRSGEIWTSRMEPHQPPTDITLWPPAHKRHKPQRGGDRRSAAPLLRRRAEQQHHHRLLVEPDDELAADAVLGSPGRRRDEPERRVAPSATERARPSSARALSQPAAHKDRELRRRDRQSETHGAQPPDQALSRAQTEHLGHACGVIADAPRSHRPTRSDVRGPALRKPGLSGARGECRTGILCISHGARA